MSCAFLSRVGAFAIALAALAACSGGGGSSDNPGQSGDTNKQEPICQVIGGGASMVTATPGSGSTFDNPNAAFDGDLDTFATLTTTGAGNDTIRGTLQPGVVEPVGQVAGIAFTTPQIGSYSITLTTFLSGVQKDSALVYQATCGGSGCAANFCTKCTARGDGQSFAGLTSSEPFDAIEANIVTTAADPFQIRELCGDPGF